MQLNQNTEGWNKYLLSVETKKKKEIRYEQLLEKCLCCPSLLRKENEKINAEPEKGFGYSLLSFNYKGLQVFSDDPYKLYEKRLVLLRKTGCESAEDYFALGETLYVLNKFDESLEALKRSDELLEDELSSKYIGLLYMHLKNYGSSEKYFLKCISINPKCSSAYRYLGDLYRTVGEYEKSITAYKNALDTFDPEETGSYDSFEFNYFGIAITYSKMELYEKVIENAQKYLYYSYSWDTIVEFVNEYRVGKVDNLSNTGMHIDEISSMYQLIAISYLHLDNLDEADNNINKAKWLNLDNVEIARIEGIVIGRKYEKKRIQEYEEQLKFLKNIVEGKLIDKIDNLNSIVKETHEKSHEIVDMLGDISKKEIIELKPNFMGFGVNLNEVFKRAYNIFKKKCKK